MSMGNGENQMTDENGAEDEEKYFLAVQRAINSGAAWKLQGSFGRGMMRAIDDGRCMLGLNPCRDYWGNRIPSRNEVQPSTRGSYEYVVEHSGEEWAAMMEGCHEQRH